MTEDLRLLYLDAFLVAVHKPAGLLVHRSRIDSRETRFALQRVRDQLGQHVYPVHRLDKPTSGVLLLARDPDTARRLTAQFTAGEVHKSYRAVVRGHPAPSGVIDYALREQPDALTDARADPHKAPQPAITHYQRLATVELPTAVGRYPSARYALVQVQPRTGRKHQIRRHLKHIFHPIIGDTTHGDGRHNRFFRERFGNRRLLLEATALRLTHPHTGVALSITTSPAPDMQRILEALGWADVA
jgi:tRNA pseudouridine65 synthase